MTGSNFSNLSTAQPESCSGQSSVSSRRPAAAYTHWSSSSLAPVSESGHSLVSSQVSNQFNVEEKKKTIYKCRDISKNGNLALVSVLLFVIAEHTPRRPLRVLCVPVVVFANSPQQNLPIGCPGLARLPNSISFLWESDGLASWYSDRQTERQKNSRRHEKDSNRWCAKELRVESTAAVEGGKFNA